jgi:hypothetical protein
MNAKQRRQRRRKYNGKLPGVQVRFAKFRRRICGAVQIPMRYAFSNCDSKGFVKETNAATTALGPDGVEVVDYAYYDVTLKSYHNNIPKGQGD